MEPKRILIIGRSPGVILDAADILRSKGFRADATNQFDEVLTAYDTANIDVVVLGGMVPLNTKKYLKGEIAKANGRVTFVEGLAGIAGLIAAQVEGVTSTAGDDNSVSYDTTSRTVQLTLHEPTPVVVEAGPPLVHGRRDSRGSDAPRSHRRPDPPRASSRPSSGDAQQ